MKSQDMLSFLNRQSPQEIVKFLMEMCPEKRQRFKQEIEKNQHENLKIALFANDLVSLPLRDIQKLLRSHLQQRDRDLDKNRQHLVRGCVNALAFLVLSEKTSTSPEEFSEKKKSLCKLLVDMNSPKEVFKAFQSLFVFHEEISGIPCVFERLNEEEMSQLVQEIFQEIGYKKPLRFLSLKQKKRAKKNKDLKIL